MLAYAHVLMTTYYAQNYASIIHQCLVTILQQCNSTVYRFSENNMLKVIAQRQHDDECQDQHLSSQERMEASMRVLAFLIRLLTLYSDPEELVATISSNIVCKLETGDLVSECYCECQCIRQDQLTNTTKH